MRKLIALVVLIPFVLCGCIYSSANLLRAKGENIQVLGAWGYVKCINSAVTLYRSTDAMSYMKDKDAKYPKVPARPTVTEDGTDIVIGKQPVATPTPEPVVPLTQ